MYIIPQRWKSKAQEGTMFNSVCCIFQVLKMYSGRKQRINGRVMSPKPQFPPHILHLSGVVNHISRINCSTSIFHACPTMSVNFISVLLYTPPCMRMITLCQEMFKLYKGFSSTSLTTSHHPKTLHIIKNELDPDCDLLIQM